jgi:hypothetical protein
MANLRERFKQLVKALSYTKPQRGEALLVEHDGYVMTAHVDVIENSDGHDYVRANIMTGRENQKVPVTWGGPGFRHVSVPFFDDEQNPVKGLRYVRVADVDGEEILRAFMDAKGEAPEPVVEQQVEEAGAVGGVEQPLDETLGSQSGKRYPPAADIDGSKFVEKPEEKKWNKEHKDEG